MDNDIVFIAIASMLALAAGFLRSHQHVEVARSRIEGLRRAKEVQVERIRQAAKTSLMLKREFRKAEDRKAELQEEIRDQTIKLAAALRVDRRVYVLDDRRGASDLSWIVTVTNTHFTEHVNPQANMAAQLSWRAGRRMVVYALDAAKAREKAATRLPERLGYQVGTIIPMEEATPPSP